MDDPEPEELDVAELVLELEVEVVDSDTLKQRTLVVNEARGT